MEFFRDSNFNFMGVRRAFLVVSLIAFIGSIVALFGLGSLNIGIDFAGGTQLIVKFKDSPDLDQLRDLLAQAGLGESQLQRFDEESENTVLIKTPMVEGSEQGSRALVESSFSGALNTAVGSKLDLNLRGREELASLLFSADPDAVEGEELARREHYGALAQEIMSVRQDEGLFTSWDQITALPGVSSEVAAMLQRDAALGAYAVPLQDYVGPQIGSELRRKGILAVIFSLIGMLVYIWLRFELRFGIGAMAALVHDVVICLGLYALARYEFNLTTIAAFLTVVGYSVNDSVVVFDRVRENLRMNRREPLVQLLNRSLNQTLSRTVLTSGTTVLAVGSLFILGGEVIRGFSFVMLTGVVIGTYSSIFVASPFVLFWERFFGREARARRAQ